MKWAQIVKFMDAETLSVVVVVVVIVSCFALLCNALNDDRMMLSSAMTAILNEQQIANEPSMNDDLKDCV